VEDVFIPGREDAAGDMAARLFDDGRAGPVASPGDQVDL
jgi:hypothetical protein